MSLGPVLRQGSSSLPGVFAERASIPLLGLAPERCLPDGNLTIVAGELLPHLCTLTSPLGGRFIFCGTFRFLAEPGCYPVPARPEPGLSSDAVPASTKVSADEVGNRSYLAPPEKQVTAGFSLRKKVAQTKVCGYFYPTPYWLTGRQFCSHRGSVFQRRPFPTRKQGDAPANEAV